MSEAQGGSAAKFVGAQWGLTASIFAYANLQSKGFALLPFNKGNV